MQIIPWELPVGNGAASQAMRTACPVALRKVLETEIDKEWHLV